MLTIWLALAASVATAGDEVSTAASWIWYPENPAVEGVDQTRYLRKVVKLEEAPTAAKLRVLADDGYVFTVNGAAAPAPVEQGRGGAVFDLSRVLVKGENVLGFAVSNSIGAGGLIVTGSVTAGGVATPLRSDPSFRTSREPAPGWDRPGFDDAAWKPAFIVGSAFSAPWYRHPAFDLDPFLEAGDRERWAALRDRVLALPPGLDREAPARAQIGFVNGSCALTINGTPRPALIYRGTVDPFSAHGRRQIGLFRDAGVHVYTAYLPLEGMWRALGPPDFTALDETVRGYLSADPQAYLILQLALVPPPWWMDAHPEELVKYAAGADYNSSDEAGRVRRPSLASAAWRRDALAIWRAALDHLEQQPWGKRVIGYHPCHGIYGEWHYYGSWTQQMPDTGPAMTAYFRDWLRKRYGDEARLREAWAQPDATFETATVPGVEPRLASDALGLREPARRRWVMDYYACQQAVTADDIELFCQAAKEVTKGRVICGAFYGYFQGVPPQTQGGHLELSRLLRSPSVDYFAAPYDYSHRLMGDDGRTRAVVDAFAQAGKVHMIEADTRTHLHPIEEYGRVANGKESVAAIRREVGTALTHGCALWWCDFGSDGSGGWYDDPELIAEVGRLLKLAEQRLKSPRQRAAQVAVVSDLPSCHVVPDGAPMATHYGLVDGVTTQLYRTGTPFDSVLLSQLGTLDLSRYRLLVFLNTLSVDPATRKIVHAAAKDRSVLWLWAPGVTDGERFGPALVEELTGFRVALPGKGLSAGIVTCEPAHALTERLPTTTHWQLVPQGTRPVPELLRAESWYNPREQKEMAETYSAFEWQAAGDAFRWRVATTQSWSDIHLKATVEDCAGLSVEVAGEGAAPGLGLRVVIKDADAAEFVAPAFVVPKEPRTFVLPLAEFVKAPWYTGTATKPRFPLSGAKFVLDGLGGGRSATLVLRGLAAVRGEATRREVRSYGDPAQSCPVLTIDDPNATPLGRDAPTGSVLLACKGAKGRRSVLSTVPSAPYQLLDALLDDAGVTRYVDSPQVIVRGDSGLLSLHTAVGGKYALRLPRAAVARDALTGALIGRGQQLTVNLPPTSTTLLSLSGD